MKKALQFALIRVVLLLIAVACSGRIATANADFDSTVLPFLKRHCTRCHGPKKQNADRRFDQLSADLTKTADAELLQEILDQLNLAQMPPEGEPRPPTDEVKRVVDWLTKSLAEAREKARAHAGKVVLRRLNRAEYFNTVRDLFQLNMTDFDPTASFPPDDSVDGFDNIGYGHRR